MDAIVTPATPSAAFGMDEKQDDPVTMYLNDVFTVTANLAGLPGLSVPAGLDAQGLPLGLQVIGRAFDEGTVFAVGAADHLEAERQALGVQAGRHGETGQAGEVRGHGEHVAQVPVSYTHLTLPTIYSV